MSTSAWESRHVKSVALSLLYRKRQQEWIDHSIRNSPDRRYDPPRCEKSRHYEDFRIRQQVQLDYLTMQAKELWAEQQTPEYQERMREMKRIADWKEYIFKNDLTQYMSEDEKRYRDDWYAQKKAKQEEEDRLRVELERDIAESEARERRIVLQDRLTRVVMGALVVGCIVFVYWLTMVMWGMEVQKECTCERGG